MNLKSPYQAIEVFTKIMASSAVKRVKKLNFLSSRLLSLPWAPRLSFVVFVADLNYPNGYGSWRSSPSNNARLVVGKRLDRRQFLSGWGLD